MHWEAQSGPVSRTSTLHIRGEAVLRVIRAMRERYEEPLSLEDLAGIAFFSPFHFSRVFRQTTGMSPRSYLTAVRLEMAKRLLLTTQLSVISICFAVGYTSVGTFTRMFTGHVGLSPRRLRQLAGKALRLLQSPLPPAADEEAAAIPDRDTVHVRVPEDFQGPVFIGLFPEALPRGRPLTCAVREGAGSVVLPAAGAGRHHLFAVGLSRTAAPMESLLCAQAPRGSATPASARAGMGRETLVTLRPPEPTDSPLLLALPFFLVEGELSNPGEEVSLGS